MERLDVQRCWVYIIHCSDGSLYTGATANVERRILRHSAGRASKYTRSRLPVTLVYLEEAASKGQALRRESAIKKLSRAQKLLLCRSRPPRLPQSLR